MKRGRPKKYCKKICDEICVWIASGNSLNRYCKKEGTPAISTVFQWLIDNPEFSDKYDKAREWQAESHVDELTDIADYECQTPVIIDGEPLMVDNKPVMQVTPAAVSHAKLRIETRRYHACKMKPRKYGDKKEVTVDLPEGAGVLLTPPVATAEDWVKLSQQANADLVKKEKQFNDKV